MKIKRKTDEQVKNYFVMSAFFLLVYSFLFIVFFIKFAINAQTNYVTLGLFAIIFVILVNNYNEDYNTNLLIMEIRKCQKE